MRMTHYPKDLSRVEDIAILVLMGLLAGWMVCKIL
jgi:hypothetical protein